MEKIIMIRVFELENPSVKELEERLNWIAVHQGHEIVSVLAYTSFWLKIPCTRIIYREKT